jgi:uncharacterized protein YdcH (DUF465 family)
MRVGPPRVIQIKAGCLRLGFVRGNKKESHMSHTPHELPEEFPDFVEKLHALKVSNAHFARLADAYHEVNRAIHRAETLVEPVAPDYESELRRKRMALKDEIAALLRAA